MINRLRIALASLLMVFSIGAVSLTVLTPTAAAADKNCASSGFLTFPAWYRGMTDDECNIKSPAQLGGLSSFIWRIAFNVIEIVLQIIAYIATIMIIVGGFRFLTSGGNASGIEQGKKTLTNAIIGLVISIASIAIVNLIFGLITGFKG